MTAQQLLDELLNLQKQGFDLDELDVRATDLNVDLPNDRVSVVSTFCILDTEVDDSDFILYNRQF
jgi:hypothetical protein